MLSERIPKPCAIKMSKFKTWLFNSVYASKLDVDTPSYSYLYDRIKITRCSWLNPRDGATACMGAKSNPPPQPPSAASIHCMHIHIYSTKWP